MKVKRPLIFIGTVLLLTGCSVFPKEEELQRAPIIQAYQQEDFKMADVKRGDIKQYEKLKAVCMGIGEKKYTFAVNDLAFEGIYVKTGDVVQSGTVLAQLQSSYTSNEVANNSQLKLTAENDGKVTYAMSPEEGEKSVSGKLVVAVNSTDGYYLSTYTKYWNKLVPGMQVAMKINGKDYTASVVSSEELGQEPTKRPENPEEESEVYFHVKDDNLYIQSTDSGMVTVLIDERDNVLYVPDSAITTVNDKEIVYVEDKDGLRSVKYIETGLHADSKVEIISGLSEGDRVILE